MAAADRRRPRRRRDRGLRSTARDDSGPVAKKSDDKPTIAPPAVTSGTVKFDHRADRGRDPHRGPRRSLGLAVGDRAAGIGKHQIEIHQSGFKSWLTTIELSAGETQTFHVVLEPLGTTNTGDATLSLMTTPGLEADLDGQLLPQHTPIKKLPLKIGAHVLSINKGGVEVWHQDLRRSRARSTSSTRRSTRSPRPRRRPSTSSARPIRAPTSRIRSRSLTTTRRRPTLPSRRPRSRRSRQGAGQGARQAAHRQARARDERADATALAGPAERPGVRAPERRHKVSGTPPNISKGRYDDDLPASIRSKLCIDTSGHVSSAAMLTKNLSRSASDEILGALKTWVYAPYKTNNVPTPACFAVNLRTKSGSPDNREAFARSPARRLLVRRGPRTSGDVRSQDGRLHRQRCRAVDRLADRRARDRRLDRRRDHRAGDLAQGRQLRADLRVAAARRRHRLPRRRQ